jgi:16S rRNA processing protein RimM
MKGFVAIGEVVKAVGLRGEVKLYPLLDYHEALLDSPFLVWDDGRPAPVEGHRQAGSCEAVKIRSVDDRGAADGIVGRELGFMAASYLEADFPRPAGGLPFRYLDREVVTATGDRVGIVTEVRFVGSNYLLVVAPPQADGGQILIPAVEPILRADPGMTGPLVVDPPEGLFDVQSG